MRHGTLRFRLWAQNLALLAAIIFVAVPQLSWATTVLRSGVISAGGAPSTSTNYRLNCTLGQPHPVGTTSSTSFIHHAGFWAMPGLSGATPVPGVLPPVDFLAQNHPNPFNPTTTIEYGMTESGPVRLAIYDISGRRVRLLADGQQLPGRFQVQWDGRGDDGRTLPSGTYVYRIETGRFLTAKRMTLLK